MFFQSLLSLMVLLSPWKSTLDALSTTIRYRHFDEFLIHLGRSQQTFFTQEVTEERVVFNRSYVSLTSRPLPIRTGVIRSKEMTCCMLGQLAGDEGYHCVAKFYAARIIFRNYNRAHNRRIDSLQANSPKHKFSEKLMRTFGQCVTKGTIFHKCCHLASLERNPDDKYPQQKKPLDEIVPHDRRRNEMQRPLRM